jgi:hypothetical protein
MRRSMLRNHVRPQIGYVIKMLALLPRYMTLPSDDPRFGLAFRSLKSPGRSE